MLLFVYSYRVLGAPHMGGACRFTPTCSEYAIQTLKIHGPRDSFILISKRIFSCRPGGRQGYDPVPTHTKCCGV